MNQSPLGRLWNHILYKTQKPLKLRKYMLYEKIDLHYEIYLKIISFVLKNARKIGFQ